MTNEIPQCIHIPDGSVVVSGELFDMACAAINERDNLLAEIKRLTGQLNFANREPPHCPSCNCGSDEPGAVTRLPVPRTQMTRLSDIADELIRQLRKQGMEKMQAVFDGMRLRIDPWPEQPVATPGAAKPEDAVIITAVSSGPRGLLAQQMEPDTSPLTHQEIFSAVHYHAAEIVKLTAAVPAQCTQGASRDASSATPTAFHCWGMPLTCDVIECRARAICLQGKSPAQRT